MLVIEIADGKIAARRGTPDRSPGTLRAAFPESA